MKKVLLVVIICIAVFAAYKLWAQGGTPPAGLDASGVQLEARHTVPSSAATKRTIQRVAGVPTHSMAKWVDFRNYDKCNRRYYSYVSPGEDHACQRVFSDPSTFEIDTENSYICRFRNNYPRGNPCPVGAIIQRVDFTGYFCKSNSDISEGGCYMGYDAPRRVADKDYAYAYFCEMTVKPRLCFDDRVDAHRVRGLDRCCIIFKE